MTPANNIAKTANIQGSPMGDSSAGGVSGPRIFPLLILPVGLPEELSLAVLCSEGRAAVNGA